MSLLLPAATVAADSTSWINLAGGLFDDPSNWSNGVPGADDTAILDIEAPNNYKLTLSALTTIDRLVAIAGNPTIVLGGTTLTLLGSNPDLPALELGDDVGSDMLVLRQGTLVAPSVSVGPLAGGSGKMLVGLLLPATASIDSTLVGDAGSGSITILPASSFTTGELLLGRAATGSGLFASVGAVATLVTGDAHVGMEGVGRIWTTDHDLQIKGDLYTATGPDSEGELRLQQEGGNLLVDGNAYFGGEGLTTVSMQDGPHLVVAGDLAVSSTTTVEVNLWNHTDPDDPAMIVLGSIDDPSEHLQPRLKIAGILPLFTPPIGAVYALINSGTPTKWPELQVPETSLARRYVPVASPTLLAVEVRAGLADLNGDNAIDQADLDVLFGDWGRGSSPADFNSDGTVDGADLGMFLSALGV